MKSDYEAWQGLECGDVVDSAAHQILGFMAISNLQWRKPAYIKRLQQMRRVRSHSESYDLVLLAVLLEFERVVALVAINNKQPPTARLIICSSKCFNHCRPSSFVVQPFL
jgi:hypothetical protein